jgi:hypothetical protein
VCTASGTNGSVFTFVGAGTCIVDANQVGNANWNPAPQVQQSFAVGKGSQTVSFTSTAPGGATVGGASYTPTATATSGLGVTITVDSSSSTICSISGGVVNFEAVGTCTLDANQAGNANWIAAPQVQQSFAVGKGSQTVSFTSTAPGGATVGGATYTPTATATSGLTPAITVDSSTSSICSIAGGVVSFQAVGTCKLDANQGGNANWNAAPQVQQSFAVGKGNQTVSFTSTAPGGATVGGATYTAAATASSGLTPVTFSSGSTSVCTASGTNGSVFTFVGAGTCIVDANQAGNANWNAAPQAQQSFAVTVLTITSVAGHTGGHPSFSGTGAVGTTVTVTVCTSNVAYPCSGHSAGTVATSGTPTGSWTTTNSGFPLTVGTQYWAYASATGTATSVVFPFIYEAGGPVPLNVTLANGGTSGTMDTGDTATMTFSEALDPSTICASWTATPTTQSVADAVVTFNHSSFQITATSATCGTLNFGTVTTPSTYARFGSNLTFTGSTITWNATTNSLTLTIGTLNGGTQRTNVGTGTQNYTAASGVQDFAGAGISITPINGTAASGF